jgi:hypothetical protein
MKKLIAIISVLAAGFVGTAKADITMSAGQSLEVQSSGSVTNVSIGGSLGFAFSQDLGNGITVTMSGLTFDNDVSVVDNIVGTADTAVTTTQAASTTANVGTFITPIAAGVQANVSNIVTTNVITATGAVATTGGASNKGIDGDAFEQISFASASGTLTYGSDVEVDYADTGVGDVTGSDLTAVGLASSDSAIALGGTTGNGISYSTTMGGTALKIGYLFANGGGNDLFDSSAAANNTTVAISTAVPVGPLTASIGYTSASAAGDDTNSIGVSTSMAVGSGTLSASYVSVDTTNDSTEMGFAYTAAMGSATLSVGYQQADTDGQDNTSMTSARISQPVGTGASVFAEMINLSGGTGTTTAGETSSIVLGSAFTF